MKCTLINKFTYICYSRGHAARFIFLFHVLFHVLYFYLCLLLRRMIKRLFILDEKEVMYLVNRSIASTKHVIINELYDYI